MKELVNEFTAGFSTKQHEQFQSSLRVIRDKGLAKMHLEAHPPSGLPAGKLVSVDW